MGEALAEAVPQDPFLANLEAHVIAKAQRRLRQRAQAHKRKDHISNARKAMKTMLLNAASRAQDRVAKVEKEEELKRQKDKKKATAKAAGGKQFTWAQLQNGDDNAKQNYAQQKMGNLLNKLKRAPKADKKKRLRMRSTNKRRNPVRWPRLSTTPRRRLRMTSRRRMSLLKRSLSLPKVTTNHDKEFIGMCLQAKKS